MAEIQALLAATQAPPSIRASTETMVPVVVETEPEASAIIASSWSGTGYLILIVTAADNKPAEQQKARRIFRTDQFYKAMGAFRRGHGYNPPRAEEIFHSIEEVDVRRMFG